MPVFCLICGCSEDEVSKMHCFPTNPAKCKLWHENLCIPYPNIDMRNYRICSNHFDKSDYINNITWRLKQNAVPMKLVAEKSQQISNVLKEHINNQRLTSIQEDKAHSTELNSSATTSSMSDQLLDETRRKVASEITELLHLVEVAGPEELLAIQKCIAPIKPSLEAIKSTRLLITQTENKKIPHNKKIINKGPSPKRKNV